MHYYEVAPNQIIRAGSTSFTYCSESELPIGQIVSIEIGKKQMIGIVLKSVAKPPYETKSITSIVEQTTLPIQLIDLALWMSRYYVTPLATVLQAILPRGLVKKRRPVKLQPDIAKRNRTNILFNVEQSAALDKIADFDDGTFLLQGVTGSGKTEIYIELAKRSIAVGRSVIILVPEIALTSQLIAEFTNHFDDLIITHSRMTESARHTAWSKALNSIRPHVVIGPRSALFTPLHNIGIIVIDEAHEPSFKQEQSPKYSALRAATMLGRFHHAKVILGSATPSIIDRYLAAKSNRPILSLTKPARSGSQPPRVTLVDMTKRDNFKKHRFLSNQLINQIADTLAEKKQSLIFHNRRGSANVTLCQDCGWSAECPKCYLPLTLHVDSHQLRCHICGEKFNISTSCPVCNSTNIIHKGIGTKLIEYELHKIFPDAKIARFDADNSIDATVNSRYCELYDGSIDIIIGTQIVAKGLDLPHLRTVGIIQADTGLSLPDYNTHERTFQLLAQVVGRVGRDNNQTQVIVQSFQPSHPSIVHGIRQDYETFYRYVLEERKKSSFPPFTHLLKLVCTYKTEDAAIRNSQKLAKGLRTKVHKDVQILGPTPAFYERQRDTYRWQLTLKSPRREYLTDALKLLPPTHWQFELDPNSLL
jgi:primosomal protein N' (replication factor Y)